MTINKLDESQLALTEFEYNELLAKRECPFAFECGLALSGKGPVIGSGAFPSPFMLIGDAPGYQEDLQGKPFVGASGDDLNLYFLRYGLERSRWYFTNRCKCRPDGNRDPEPNELDCCLKYLLYEIKMCDPVLIVLAGRIAASVLPELGRAEMVLNGETVRIVETDIADAADFPELVHTAVNVVDYDRQHGIPLRAKVFGKQITFIPVYHPAAGLHNHNILKFVQEDFAAVGEWVKGNRSQVKYTFACGHSRELKTDAAIWDAFTIQLEKGVDAVKRISIDTESLADGSPFLLSFAFDNDETPHTRDGFVFDPRSGALTSAFVAMLVSFCDTVIFHHALHDLAVLRACGYDLTDGEKYRFKLYDTMTAAYLLSERQGLKMLAYRRARILQPDYTDVLRGANNGYAEGLCYLANAADLPDIPAPLPEFVLDKKTKQPTYKDKPHIRVRIQRLLKKSPENIVDLAAAWQQISLNEGRGNVEALLGLFPVPDLSGVDRAAAIIYSAGDAAATVEVYKSVSRDLIESGQAKAFDDPDCENSVMARDMRMIPYVADMSAVGIGVDVDHFRRLHHDYIDRVVELKRKIIDAAGGEKTCGVFFNPGSADQLAALLYDRLGLGLPRPKRGGKRSTDQKQLEKLKNSHPVIPLIMQYRQAEKFLGGFIEVILTKAHGGRVYAEWKTTRTATGRLAAASPNLMNLPTRGIEGKHVRNGFIASPGCVFVSADYSQIEMRIAGDESGDPLLCEIFILRQDIHTQTAIRVFKLPENLIDNKKHRYPCKRVGFGTLYGITALGLLDQLNLMGADNWTEKTAQKLIDDWFDTYQGVKRYMARNASFARQNGFVCDRFGRRIYIPEVWSSQPHIVERGIRRGGNGPIQSGAQGVIKEAMGQLVPVYREFRKFGKCDPVNQVHDDLMFEVDKKLVNDFVPCLTGVMENAVKLRHQIPVVVDVKTGERWGDLCDYDYFDVEDEAEENN